MDLIQQLRRDEGVRYTMYRDQFGNPTIGVGHLVLPNESWLMTASLNDDQVNTLLATDIGNKTSLMIQYAWFTALDPVRQGAVLNQAFNVGVSGLIHFPHELAALARSDWHSAAGEMLSSLWASQLHYNPNDPLASRPGRLAAQVITGAWV
jgi:lysozyme